MLKLFSGYSFALPVNLLKARGRIPNWNPAWVAQPRGLGLAHPSPFPSFAVLPRCQKVVVMIHFFVATQCRLLPPICANVPHVCSIGTFGKLTLRDERGKSLIFDPFICLSKLSCRLEVVKWSPITKMSLIVLLLDFLGPRFFLQRGNIYWKLHRGSGLLNTCGRQPTDSVAKRKYFKWNKEVEDVYNYWEKQGRGQEGRAWVATIVSYRICGCITIMC